MGIKERLFEHPGSFFAGCIVWIPLAIWIYSLVVWTIQGDIDTLFGLFGVSIALGLGYFTMNPPNQNLAPLFFFAATATVVFFPFVRGALSKRELQDLDVELIERSYKALGERPNNPALRFRLARALYQRGLVDAAIAVAEKVIGQLPREYYTDEHLTLAHWQRGTRSKRPETFHCIECAFDNERGQVFCQNCGAPLFLPHAEGRVFGTAFARKMLAVWGLLVLLGVGIPTAMAALPPLVAIVVIVVMTGLGVYAIVAAFQGEEGARSHA